ncbi:MULTISPECIES: RNA polymerase sigma factor [unclassified Prevotella]|jgi:RNA polymerase sigma-70 factor (ECF subfamily)|uniref:RNA polymerase sigma factor n=1 Tax=unclassified Prevotella TaxID=2638335 RepID=UPI000569A429|nr:MULTISPECIES: sigma-70 family RNA polymerase sigma factor [unclassified Prevotella]MCR5469897.1 sigma-70 family RNA polymerase sigma factor [Prevotella sp.]SEV85458.1 RNA polymerase sigma-70 factor, ECF subfamily [Prevotella sp. khp7]
MIEDQQIFQLLSDASTQRRGFELLVRKYSEQLYWQIRRIVLTHDDANDVLQNTFLKAWNGLENFQGDAKIVTWLSRIAINESLDQLRRNKHMVSGADEDLSVANMLMADSYFDGSEAEALLQEAIASLPDVQRTVFQLRYFEDMKYSEMSLRLNTSEGALKASYHIAVKKISDFFKARD